jgi:predicted branched-subunit amino acid permease
MTITIPIWVLWTLGILVGAVVCGVLGFFAIIGWQMPKVFHK